MIKFLIGLILGFTIAIFMKANDNKSKKENGIKSGNT